MRTSDIYVAGLGVISALGKDLKANRHALLSGESGIGAIKHLKTIHKDVFSVGEVKYSNADLEQTSHLPPGTSRTALLSSIAAREAYTNAGLHPQTGLKIGFVSANSVGGMDKSEDFYSAFSSDHQKGRLRDVVGHECGCSTELVARQLGIYHYVSTISTACSSSANAIFHAARMIAAGYLDVAIAGGAESLTRFTLNGFNTLMILDPNPCKPLDENRKGLNLGEGAGYVVLASEYALSKLNTKAYCRLSGWHNVNDAFHQTASSPDGAGSYMAMQGAIRKSGIRKEDIGYINLHGTSTQNNDLSEGTALIRLFGETLPKLSSTKAYTGHTLGASGGIEAVYSVMSVVDGYVYPNLRFETPMKDAPLHPVTSFDIDRSIRHVLSNSFGFGGNCSSLIFSAT